MSLGHNEQTVDLDGLNPIPFGKRTMSPISYAMVFWSSTIIVQVMVIGLYLLPPSGGLNFLQVIGVGLISGLIISLFMTLNGDMGMRYGVPFIIQARSGLGIKGARMVAFIRSIPAVCWNGIGTWIGAMSMEVVTNQLFGWGNVWVYFFLLLAIQSFLAYKGVTSITWFDSLMSIIIFVMLIYFFYVVFSSGKVNFAEAASFSGTWSLPFIAGIMAATANFTTVILNSSDLIRHIKPGDNKKFLGRSAFANFFGIIPPWMFMVLSGMVIGLATGSTDPIQGLIELSPNPAFGMILLVFIVLAQVTSNLTLNILPPALAIQDIFNLSWKKGVIAVAVLSVITAPWLLFTSNYFFLFQNVYSSFLGPATGVLIADYYFIRKRRMNLEILYDDKGVYNYAGGFSPAGMTALVIGAIVSFMFLNYSWLIGFPFTVVFYTILKKSGMERKYEELEKKAPSKSSTMAS